MPSVSENTYVHTYIRTYVQRSTKFVSARIPSYKQVHTGCALQDKLAGLRQQAPEAAQAPTTTSLTWRSITYPVHNDRIRGMLSKALDAQQQLETAMDVDQQELGDPEDLGDQAESSRKEQLDRVVAAFAEVKGGLGSILKVAVGETSFSLVFCVTS